MSIVKKRFIIVMLILIIIAVLVLIALANRGYLNTNESNNMDNTQESTQQNIQAVSVVALNDSNGTSQNFNFNGIVEADENVTITPETSGRISEVFYNEDAWVNEDSVIATIENEEKELALQRAKNNLEDQQLRLQELEKQFNTATASLQKSILEQKNTAIENARVARNSNALKAVPRNESTTLTPPEISGTYTGPEGNYKLEIERGYTSEYVYVETFGLEKTETDKLPENQSVPLGTHGLKIKLPENPKKYVDTIWDVTIPNKEVANYPSLQNAYEEAQRAKKVASRQNEITEEELARQQNAVEKAKLNVEEAELALEKTEIKAPLSGELVSLNINEGEYVTSATDIGAIKKSQVLELKFYLSQYERNRIDEGDPIVVNGEKIGRVFDISSSFDSDNLKIEARARLNNKGRNKYIEGESVSFQVTTESNGSDNEPNNVNYELPLTAIKVIGSTPHIGTVASDSSVRFVPVETGVLLGNSIEVNSGLTNVDSIITNVRGLQEKTRVRIKSSEQ